MVIGGQNNMFPLATPSAVFRPLEQLASYLLLSQLEYKGGPDP